MYERRARIYISRCLADAFLAGAWTERAMVDRAGHALTRRPRWVRSVAREVLASYHRPPQDRPRELARFIEIAIARRTAPEDETEAPRVRRWLVPEPAMGSRRWPVPEIASLHELAAFLGVSDEHLAWLADVRGLERTVADQRLRNYTYSLVPRRRPGPPRVIERPKPRLKAVQRRLLHEMLDLIPVHEAAHGFTRGRSAVTHATEHTGRFVVVRIDLQDFFASISAARVYGIFRTAGYPESVAHTLTALTTNTVPGHVQRTLTPSDDRRQVAAYHRLRRRLATPHLPQGAPTSPALANLAAFRLDRRLAGLAAALGLTYTRYADDLTFSGGRKALGNAVPLRAAAAQIASDEGFAVNVGKTTLTTRAGCQQVCGIVVNRHANLRRAEYDSLRAILHNAARDGPAPQNLAAHPDFRAHLLGRIAWVELLNPGRGAKLRRRFQQIAWERG